MLMYVSCERFKLLVLGIQKHFVRIHYINGVVIFMRQMFHLFLILMPFYLNAVFFLLKLSRKENLYSND